MKYMLKFLESQYNFHKGYERDIDMENIQPHYSDNIFRMQGRGTGHFGSGMYFSTYKNEDLNDTNINNPKLTQINGGLYRVDFDIYKNLYRVHNERQGDFLFKTLKKLNSIFEQYRSYKKYDGKLPPDLSKHYMIIKHNLDILGLDVPDYKKFIDLLQSAYVDIENGHEDAKSSASFSTRIMEWNGWNGVNVSGVTAYDNTLHGSVIYDMSKLEDTPKKINLKSLLFKNLKNDVITEYEDIKSIILADETLSKGDIIKLNNLPESESIQLIKRYNKWISPYYINVLSPKLLSAYLKSLPNKLKNDLIKIDSIKDVEFLMNNNLSKLIYDDIKVDCESLLEYCLKNYWVFNTTELKSIIDGINRELTEDEQYYYDIAINDLT